MDIVIYIIINLAIGFGLAFLYASGIVPGWVLFFVLIPFVTLGMITYSTLYNFRDSLDFDSIPPAKFESRTHSLDKDVRNLAELAFEKVDTFYLKMVPDCVCYVLRHRKLPVYLNLYHFGQKKASDFMTFFENDIMLTTSASIDGGNVPPPAEAMLQIFENVPNETLFQEHMKAVRFVEQKGLKVIQIPVDEFRRQMMASMKDAEKRIRMHFMWPIVLIFWVVTGRGKFYAKPIEAQYESGIYNFLNKD